MLRQRQRHAIIHDQKTSLDDPNRQNLHLLHDQHQLRAKDTRIDFRLRIFPHVLSRLDEIAARFDDAAHGSYKHRVGGLLFEISLVVLRCLQDKSYHRHQNQVIIEL